MTRRPAPLRLVGAGFGSPRSVSGVGGLGSVVPHYVTDSSALSKRTRNEGNKTSPLKFKLVSINSMREMEDDHWANTS